MNVVCYERVCYESVCYERGLSWVVSYKWSVLNGRHLHSYAKQTAPVIISETTELAAMQLVLTFLRRVGEN